MSTVGQLVNLGNTRTIVTLQGAYQEAHRQARSFLDPCAPLRDRSHGLDYPSALKCETCRRVPRFPSTADSRHSSVSIPSIDAKEPHPSAICEAKGITGMDDR